MKSSTSPAPITAIAIACALVACRRPSPEQRVDGWKYVREALTNGKECFAGKPEYCLTDPEIVDGAIRPRLKVLYDGEMPERDIKVWALARASAREYRRALTTPENIGRVEELVRERYGSPVVTTDPDTVHIDLGVVPGKIASNEANHTLHLLSSSAEEAGFWAQDEARRVLGDYAKKYSDKNNVEAKVTVGVSGVFNRLTYNYRRDAHRIFVVDENGEAWTTDPLRDDNDGAIESAALKATDLHPCRPPSGSTSLEACDPIKAEADSSSAPR